MQPSVYIETSVISYLTAKPSRDLIISGHQQITSEWWEQIRPYVRCFISESVGIADILSAEECEE
jgi:hypothetical protein